MDNEEKKKILKKASSELATALNKLGPKMVLDLLVVHSNRDEFVSYLLTQYPVTVALGDFYRLPIFKLSPKRKGRKRKSRITSPTSQKGSSSLLTLYNPSSFPFFLPKIGYSENPLFIQAFNG